MDNFLWQNREIRFDVDARLLKLVPGENLVAKIENVEDLQAPNGDIGTVRLTNMRVMWHAVNRTGINLTIGYSMILKHEKERDLEKYKGEALSLFAHYLGFKVCKFIFKATTEEQQADFYETFQSALKSYEATSVAIESLINQGSLIDESGNLRLLSMEQVNFRVDDVWDLGKEKTRLGTLFVTNWRLVWCTHPDFKEPISLPYLRLSLVRIYERKAGSILVIRSSTPKSNCLFAWKLFPNDRQTALCHQIQDLLKARKENPIFGATFHEEEALESSELDVLDGPLEELHKKLEGEVLPKKTYLLMELDPRFLS